VSVVLSTFDQPNALAFALAGFQRQSFRDFEVVVADDGSDGVTRAVVEEFRAAGTFPVKHVWQENRGFRKARIVNKGILASEGAIVLLTDGDCIPHREFVRAHAEAGGEGRFATGGHVHLSADFSRTLTLEMVREGRVEDRLTAADRWHFRLTHWKNVLGILLGNAKKPKAYGRNFSVDRELLFALNGYDNNFDGFTREDSDLRNRLRRHGARPVSLWGRAWVFHVDDAADPAMHVRRIPRRKEDEYYPRPVVPVRCANGIDQVRGEPTQPPPAPPP
jgi:glycosyltransferase involved in cell wall biosynthesis